MLNVVRRRLPLGERTDVCELLDSGGLTPREVEANLADLARMNRLPGGTATSAGAIERLLGRGNVGRILDVGTGAADMPLAFARRGWPTVALDANADVLDVARREAAGEELVTVVEGDASALPFDDGAFDVVHASLLLHHLGPAEAVVALREMRRVARAGVVVNDLRRGMWPMAAMTVTLAALARSRVTHVDGRASLRRSYTIGELDALLERAGLRTAWRSTAWMPRVVTAATR